MLIIKMAENENGTMVYFIGIILVVIGVAVSDAFGFQMVRHLPRYPIEKENIRIYILITYRL